jgi:hypothetical protein
MTVAARARLRAFALLPVAAVTALALAAPAHADTKPPTAGTPVTVSTDVLPTAQLNGVAWTQLVVGNTVFVGGSFTKARPAGAASGVSTSTRNNMLAYNLSTGALLSGFAPSFNGEVRGIAASVDGSTLYVGGAFTTVNGAAHSRIAAISATTGAPVSTFKASANSEVMAVVRSGSTLYLGGKFTTVNGSARSRAGAVSTGGSIASWSPNVADGEVRALVVNPAAARVVLGGSFSGLNGNTNKPYQGSGMVDTSTGRTNQPWAVGYTAWDHGTGSAIMSLTSDGTDVYGTGYVYNAGNQGNLEGAFSASWTGGAVHWIEDCHGDTYSIAIFRSAAYTAGHAHFCGNIGGFPQETPSVHHRGIAFTTAATGVVKRNTVGTYPSFAGNPAPSLLTWFPDFDAGTYTGQNQGPWSVATGTNYVVYAGEFTSINGKHQQGLARFAVPALAPNKDGPRASNGSLRTTLTKSGSTVTVSWVSSWDRDNQSLSYRVYRGSTQIATVTGLSEFWSQPTLSYTDTGRSGTVSYHVVAVDPFGNTQTGATVSTTVG